jgi:hypothetical protein
MVTFTFGCGRKRRDLQMQPQGQRRYQPDYDRGVILRELPDGSMIHRYCDENVWRDAFGNVLPDQPAQ